MAAWFSLRTSAFPVLVSSRLSGPNLNPDGHNQKFFTLIKCKNCQRACQERKLHNRTCDMSEGHAAHKNFHTSSVVGLNVSRMFSNGKDVPTTETESDAVKPGDHFMQAKRTYLSLFSKLKSSFEPWLKSATSPSVMKSLNLNDVPKFIQEQFKQDTDKSDENMGQQEVHKSTSVKGDTETETAKPRVRKTYIFQDRNVKREEYDFKEAMKQTSQSINEYFQPMKGLENSSGFDDLKTKKYASESYIGVPKSNQDKTADGDKMGFVKTLEPWMDKVLDVIPAEYRRRTGIGKATKVTSEKLVYSKTAINSRTRALVRGLKTAVLEKSKLARMEELSKHLLLYPESQGVAVKERAIPILLKISKNASSSLSSQARECLALVGHVDSLNKRGIRILSIDGGGTRGLMSIRMLKKLEEVAEQPVNESFDYICGVSTGALLAVLIGCLRVPLDECMKIYKEFSLEMFERSKIIGASQLVFNHAFYDTQIWENILKANLGNTKFIETTREKECPKVCAVSSIINRPNIENFMFRNYTLPAGVESSYIGSCQYTLWEAVRASSAAPGYYEVFNLGDYVHQDGGLLTNNPTALAIHECRLLWPNEQLQCVISLGNGRYEPTEVPDPDAYKSIKGKMLKFVQSATDTQAVHTTLSDLLPPSTYFRFNPYMTEDCLLDEIREDKLDQLMQDTAMYLRKNELKMEAAARQLKLSRRPHQKLADWLNAKLAKF